MTRYDDQWVDVLDADIRVWIRRMARAAERAFRAADFFAGVRRARTATTTPEAQS